MGPQGDRMDLLQQLVHLDDDLGRKLCVRLLAVTHGHNHASSRNLHDEVTPHEDAFYRLLHLLPVLLTANHLTDNARAKIISEIIQGNCERFQLSQWQALCDRPPGQGRQALSHSHCTQEQRRRTHRGRGFRCCPEGRKARQYQPARRSCRGPPGPGFGGHQSSMRQGSARWITLGHGHGQTPGTTSGTYPYPHP